MAGEGATGLPPVGPAGEPADAEAADAEPAPPRSPLLFGLDADQRRAVTTEAHPLCILAGAGSGKTRVLTRRIAWRIASGQALAQHVVALTFTRRAAGELRDRLRALGVRDQVVAGTFHSVAYAQLRRYWAEAGERPPALVESKLRLIAPLVSGDSCHPADVATEIEWAKARMVRPERYLAEVEAAGRRLPLPVARMAEVYGRYEREKRVRHVIDFDDLLLDCARAIEDDPRFAAAQRWNVRHFFVDEFQDVNPAQFRLLRAWLGESRDLCVVGDSNQAIYGWNGADPAYLRQFRRWFPDGTVVRLDHNYRSSPQILAVAAAVAPSGDRLRPHQPDGPLPVVRSYTDDEGEAKGIARRLREWRGAGHSWAAGAVLARTHGQLVFLDEALRRAGIPCRVRGSAPFLDLREVREALGPLRRRPTARLAAALPDLQELIRKECRSESDTERRGNLEELVRLAREHLAADPSATVAGFLGWLAASFRSTESATPHREAVELATLHAAKGLEWPIVFLVGFEAGLVPIGHADTRESRHEELRLVYVGVTRAQRELHVSWAERRTFGDRTLSRNPSPFLARIEAAVAAARDDRPGADWRRYLAEGRGRIRAKDPVMAGSGADPTVLAALRSWRAAEARASCVPPHVLFHDTTLAAVAEARPACRDDLVALPGVGPLKAERYGEALLSVVNRAV